MEQEPENVFYIDEYPEARKRVWLRRLNAQREAGTVVLPRVIELPTPPDPNDAA